VSFKLLFFFSFRHAILIGEGLLDNEARGDASPLATPLTDLLGEFEALGDACKFFATVLEVPVRLLILMSPFLLAPKTLEASGEDDFGFKVLAYFADNFTSLAFDNTCFIETPGFSEDDAKSCLVMLGYELTSESFFLPTAVVFVFIQISLDPEPWPPSNLVDELIFEFSFLRTADVFFLIQISLGPEPWLSADLVDTSCVNVIFLNRTSLETGLRPSNDFVRGDPADDFFLARTSLETGLRPSNDFVRGDPADDSFLARASLNIELWLSKDLANKPAGVILLVRTSLNSGVWLTTDLVDTSRLMISGLLALGDLELGLDLTFTTDVL
jgi:hypothetical protein